MDDFSLYQWLVVCLLGAIAFFLVAVGLAMERNLDAVTRRLEAALQEIHDETEKAVREIQSLQVVVRDNQEE